jgi:hypothetical protein
MKEEIRDYPANKIPAFRKTPPESRLPLSQKLAATLTLILPDAGASSSFETALRASS